MLATLIKLLAHYTKGTLKLFSLLTACLKKCFTSFHSGTGIFFTCPLQYLFTIAHKTNLDLEGGSPILEQRTKSTALHTFNYFALVEAGFPPFLRSITNAVDVFR